MRERIKKKKNMIIGGLVALIFVMSVGYAAFATNLNISGTANTSSWIIKITNIREKTHTGGADTVNTSFTDLSASFSSTLTKPGDSVTYEVTVENRGNIDASLKEVTKTYTQNKYIDVTYSGLVKGQMLYKQGGAGSTAVMEVTVTFKDIEIESLTETITSNITISLDFQQEGNNVDTTKKYLVTYDSEGGNAIESRYVKWNENGMASSVDPIKIGYNFGGWFSQRLGSGTKAITSTSASEFMESESDEGFTLYAYWTAKIYTINYDGQGSSTSIGTTSYGWDNMDVKPSTTPKFKGYRFDNWYTAPNGGGLKIDINTTVSEIVQYIYGKYTDVAGGTNGDEVTLYANWIEKEFTIQFNSRGGSDVPNQQAKWTETLSELPTPTKEGYTFNGWWTTSSGGTQITSSTPLSGFLSNDNNNINRVIYAHWIENQ